MALECVVGWIYENKQNEKFTILEKMPKNKVKIKFLDEYGYEYVVHVRSVRQKQPVNPYRITVLGKGCHGSIKGLNVTVKERRTWFNLLKSEREYPIKWNCLENFIRDVRELEYYEDFLENDDLTLQPICEGNVVVGFEVDYKKSNRHGKKVKIRNVYDNSVEEFNSVNEAREELGWCGYAIRKYCNENRVIDGYEYSWLKYGE